MDLSKAISFNSLTVNGSLSPVPSGAGMSGYAVEQVDVTPVDVTQRLDKRALQDGLDAQDVYLGGRHITAIIAVWGSTHGDFWDKAQDLLAAFSPTLAFAADSASLGYLPFDFYQPTADIASWPTSAYPNGIPLRYYCRPMSPPSYVMRRDEQGGVAGLGMSKRFSLSLLARDPRKVAQTTTTASLSQGSNTATTKGDYTALATISIVSASSSAVGTMNLNVNGSSATVSIEAGAIATYLWSASTGLLTKNGTSRMDLITVGAVPPILNAGANTIVLGSLGQTGATVTISWRDSFT